MERMGQLIDQCKVNLVFEIQTKILGTKAKMKDRRNIVQWTTKYLYLLSKVLIPYTWCCSHWGIFTFNLGCVLIFLLTKHIQSANLLELECRWSFPWTLPQLIWSRRNIKIERSVTSISSSYKHSRLQFNLISKVKSKILSLLQDLCWSGSLLNYTPESA